MAGPSLRTVVMVSLGCGAVSAAALAIVLVGEQSAERGAPPRRPRVLSSCDGPPEDGPVEIRLSHVEDRARTTVLATLVEGFEAAHPHVDVVLDHVSGGDVELLDDWRDSTPTQRSDLAMFPQQSSRRLVDSGQTVAPGDCLIEALPEMVPVIEGAWTFDGVIQAVPLGVSTPILLYNRQVFAAGGLDPDDPPTTLAEVREAAEHLVDAGAAKVGLMFDTGAESGGSWFVEQTVAQAGELSVLPANGREGPAESVAWLDGAAFDTISWLGEMVDDGLARSVGIDTTRTLVDAGAPDTLAAMAIHTSGALSTVYSVLDQGLFPEVDLGVAPWPGPGGGTLPGGNALWLSAGQPPAETQAAWQLAAYLASPAVDARWAAETGSVPITHEAAGLEPLASAWREHPGLRVGYDVLAAQGTSPAELGPSVGPGTELHKRLAKAVADVVAKGVDPEEALAAAADDADRLLAAYAPSG